MLVANRESVLVTLSCPHFAIFPAETYRGFTRALALEQEPTWRSLLFEHSETQWSLESLLNLAPTVLISMHLTCGRTDCIFDQRSWPAELDRIINGLRNFFNTRKAFYLDIANAYFSLLLNLPARAINGNAVVFAHRHLAVETRRWDTDTFFDPWRDAADALNSTTSNDLRGKAAAVRDALRYLIRVMPDMNRLTDDVWRLKELAEMHLQKPRQSRPIPPRRPSRRKFSLEREIDSQKIIFARNLRMAWQRRMMGFEDFGVTAVIEPQPQLESEMEWESDEGDELPTLERYPLTSSTISTSLADELWWLDVEEL